MAYNVSYILFCVKYENPILNPHRVSGKMTVAVVFQPTEMRIKQCPVPRQRQLNPRKYHPSLTRREIAAPKPWVETHGYNHKVATRPVIATHSPILMAYPDSSIYECSPEGVTETQYEQTEHYQVTRDFLMNKERMLKILLED